jgi:hypothetical protein
VTASDAPLAPRLHAILGAKADKLCARPEDRMKSGGGSDSRRRDRGFAAVPLTSGWRDSGSGTVRLRAAGGIRGPGRSAYERLAGFGVRDGPLTGGGWDRSFWGESDPSRRFGAGIPATGEQGSLLV